MNLHRRRPRRLLAGVLAGTLGIAAAPLLGVPAAGAADALPPLADPIADGAFCDGAPATNPFTDLGSETEATRQTILCLVATELTTGTTATTYTPGGTVTRRQMATFIKRLADLFGDLQTGSLDLAALPAYDGTSDFSDVPASDSAVAAINQLSQADIVGGFSDGTFRPNEPVSRRQMAAFVNRLQDFLTGSPYTTTKDYFADDEGDAGEANLNALASVGVFQGDGAGNVDPGGQLTRRQMANILLRDAQVYFAAGTIDTPFGPETNASFTVTPSTPLTQEVIGEPNANDDREYTVTGLVSGTTYTIQLYPAANVHGDTTFTFTEDGATNTADEGAVTADITAVNGTAVVGADDDATGKPVGTQMTFTIDGFGVETVVPVIYKDADADGNLDLNADNTPIAAEPFGVGGSTRYLPAEAGIGASGFTVTSVTAERDAFLSGGATYYMDANDSFRYQGVPISQAQFDSMLGLADVGNASYNPDPNGVSIFDMTGDVVAAPAAPTVTVTNGDAGPTANDARITYTRPANSPGVTYVLQRSVVTPTDPLPCGSITDMAGAFTTVAGATEVASGSDHVFSDNNVPDGCYTYRIRAVSPVSGNTADSAAPAAKAVPAA